MYMYYKKLRNPVEINEGGIKLRPQDMELDKIYHCIYQDKIFLFYKDEVEGLHCYEVADKNLIDEITNNPEKLESILEKYKNNI